MVPELLPSCFSTGNKQADQPRGSLPPQTNPPSDSKQDVTGQPMYMRLAKPYYVACHLVRVEYNIFVPKLTCQSTYHPRIVLQCESNADIFVDPEKVVPGSEPHCQIEKGFFTESITMSSCYCHRLIIRSEALIRLGRGSPSYDRGQLEN